MADVIKILSSGGGYGFTGRVRACVSCMYVYVYVYV